MANFLLEPFYTSKKIEDLGMLKGGTPRYEKLRKILKKLDYVLLLKHKSKEATIYSEASGTDASNRVLTNFVDY